MKKLIYFKCLFKTIEISWESDPPCKNFNCLSAENEPKNFNKPTTPKLMEEKTWPI